LLLQAVWIPPETTPAPAGNVHDLEGARRLLAMGIADLGSSTDTLKIDTASNKWTETTADPTLGPTAQEANISVSGLTAHTYTDGVDKVTVFHNAEVTQLV